MHIFPGNSYGFIEFKSKDNAKKIIESSTKVAGNLVANSNEIKFPDRVRNIFFFYSKLKLDELIRFQQTNLPNASLNIELPGLKIIENFITSDEEAFLFKEIDKSIWHPLANRRVQHYGYEFIYGKNTIDKNANIGNFPEYYKIFQNELNKISYEHNQNPLDQLTINDYFPGQGIPPHIDTHSPFEECFVSLSLGSGTVMNFKNNEGQFKYLFIPPRSLTIFSGEARYAWSHSIAQRKLDRVEGKLFFRRRRISLTFRKVRYEPCKCNFPIFCDSQTIEPIKFEDDKNQIKNKQDDENVLDNAEDIKIDNNKKIDDLHREI